MVWIICQSANFVANRDPAIAVHTTTKLIKRFNSPFITNHLNHRKPGFVKNRLLLISQRKAAAPKPLAMAPYSPTTLAIKKIARLWSQQGAVRQISEVLPLLRSMETRNTNAQRSLANHMAPKIIGIAIRLSRKALYQIHCSVVRIHARGVSIATSTKPATQTAKLVRLGFMVPNT